MKSLIVSIFCMLTCNLVNTNSQLQSLTGKNVINNINYNPIVFPSEDTNKNHTFTHNRQPVVDRKRCNPDSELLYPGDNEADWVCDCRPGYIYYPQTQKCYLAFSKGPCANGYFLFKDKSSSIPKCVENPCRDGQVLFQNHCYPLNGEEGCKNYKKLIGRKVILTVDPTTLALQCRDEDDKIACDNFCCEGGFRDSIGKCDQN